MQRLRTRSWPVERAEDPRRAVNVRRAAADDARAIAEVHVQSWKAAFPGLVPQDYLDALVPGDRLSQWTEDLASQRWPAVFVAEQDNTVVGFAAVAPSEDPDADPRSVGELRTIYLRPGSWSRGLGAALLEAAVDELRAAGFEAASLWVLHSNARARRFYERHGWRPDGSTKEHDWEAFVATDVRYVRRLDRAERRPRTEDPPPHPAYGTEKLKS